MEEGQVSEIWKAKGRCLINNIEKVNFFFFLKADSFQDIPWRISHVRETRMVPSCVTCSLIYFQDSLFFCFPFLHFTVIRMCLRKNGIGVNCVGKGEGAKVILE